MFNDLSFSAWYEDRDCEFTVVHKYQGSLFESKQVNQQKKSIYKFKLSSLFRHIHVLMLLLGMETTHHINTIYENL
jgi:hypothetical protein